MSRERPSHFKLNFAHSLAKGLVFAGMCNSPGSIRYTDSGPYRFNSTLTTMAPPSDWVWIPYLKRFALDFDGVSDYVATGKTSFPGTNLFCDSNEKFTVSCWVYPRDVGTFVARSSATSSEKVFHLYRGSTDAVTTYIRGAGATHAIMNDNEWAHVLIKWDGSVCSIYINGKFDENVTIGAIADDSQTCIIGARTEGTGYHLNGILADVMIWNRDLSLAEIQFLSDPNDAFLDGLIQKSKRTYSRPPYFAINSNIDLYTEAPHGNQSGCMNLFLKNDNEPNNNMDLFILGPSGLSDETTLYIRGDGITDGAYPLNAYMPLFIARDSESVAENIPLYMAQHEVPNNIDSYILGHITTRTAYTPSTTTITDKVGSYDAS